MADLLEDMFAQMIECRLQLQDGNFLVFQDKAIVHNVSGTPPSSGYTVFPGVELPGFAMAPARLTDSSSQADNLTCSTDSSAPRLAQVNACATSARGPNCCIDTALYMVSATVLLTHSDNLCLHGCFGSTIPEKYNMLWQSCWLALRACFCS